MTGYKVEEDVHSTLVSFIKKLHQVLVSVITRSDSVIVLNVIACVAKR